MVRIVSLQWEFTLSNLGTYLSIAGKMQGRKADDFVGLLNIDQLILAVLFAPFSCTLLRCKFDLEEYHHFHLHRRSEPESKNKNKSEERQTLWRFQAFTRRSSFLQNIYDADRVPLLL